MEDKTELLFSDHLVLYPSGGKIQDVPEGTPGKGSGAMKQCEMQGRGEEDWNAAISCRWNGKSVDK